MHVNGIESIHHITVADLIEETRAWTGGFLPGQAAQIIHSTLEAIASNIDTAASTPQHRQSGSPMVATNCSK